MKKKEFDGKVAIVTGAGSGMGRSLSIQLAASGAYVYATGIEVNSLYSVVDLIRHKGGSAEAFSLDVTKANDVEDFRSLVFSQHAHVDYLFNNAGITLIADAVDMQLSHWKKIFDVNFFGTVNCIQAFYPSMVAAGGGHIINTASLAAYCGYPTSAAYAASKAAVLNLSQSLRYEAEEFGVRVTAVCPGYVDTDIFRGDRALNANMKEIIADIPFKMISACQAAKYILQGVAKRQDTIVFPNYAKLVAVVARLSPRLLRSQYEQLVKSFRNNRIEKDR